MSNFNRFLTSNFTNNAHQDLLLALDEVLKKTDEAFYEANRHLDALRYDVKNAKQEIDDFENKFKKKKCNNTEITQALTDKFADIKREFDNIVSVCENDIGNKHKNDSKFNIALFGRTMAGKSTLMSILTSGNDDKIGIGKQRTTREVHPYEWYGMKISDTPGIDAFEGETDEKKAYDAAKEADLIVFLITAGQPESTEADWLVKLKREDKPLICLCNWKASLEDSRLERFLKNPEQFKKNNDCEGIIKQFNSFIQETLPNECIDIIEVQLQAMKKAELQQDKNIKAKLIEISNFKAFESKLINDVRFNALFYRRKSYLSIIDTSLFQISQKLFDSSAETLKSQRLIESKKSDFDKWSEKFKAKDIKDEIQNFVSDITRPLSNSVHQFASDHVDKKNANEEWNKRITAQNFKEKVQAKYECIVKKCIQKTNEFFSDLNTEMKLSQTFSEMFSKSLDADKGFNWRRFWGWSGTIVGATGGILAALAQLSLITISGPIGWIAAGVGVLFGLFGLFSDSKAEKQRKAIEKIETQLNDNISKIQNKIREILSTETNKAIKEIFDGAKKRFEDIDNLSDTLTKSQRNLALEINKEHIEITKQIFDYAKESYKSQQMLNMTKLNSEKILFLIETLSKSHKNIVGIGRVPGKHILIAVNEKIALPDDFNKTLGNNDKIEQVVVQGIGREAQLKSAALSLLNQSPDTTNYKKEKVVYMASVIDDSKKDYITLLQQIFNTQIVTK